MKLIFTLGLLATFGFSVIFAGFIHQHSYYPLPVYHHHSPASSAYSVLPHIHSHSYYPAGEVSEDPTTTLHHHHHAAHLHTPSSPSSSSSATARHSRSPPIQFITIPLSVLKQLLHREPSKEIMAQPLMLRVEDRNVSMSDLANMKNLTSTLSRSTPNSNELIFEKLLQVESSKYNASTPRTMTLDEPFGRRLVSTQGPFGGFKSGYESSNATKKK